MRWIRNPFFTPPPAAASGLPSPLIPPPPAFPGSGGGETTTTNTDNDDSDLERGRGVAAAVVTGQPAAAARSISSSSSSASTITIDNHRREDGDGGPALVLLQRPTDTMTGHQFFYIFVLDGLGAMVLSGGINFAIAYAMYTIPPPTAAPIRLWQLPNTLAGDGAVTIIIQSIITWLVELVLVNRDLSKGVVAPIGFIPPPPLTTRLSRAARWFLFLDRTTEAHEPGSAAHWAGFMFSQVVRAMVMAVLSFALLWGPSVGILMAFGTRSGGDWVYERTWTPQMYKLVLGGIQALLTTPLFALFWLVRAGWALRTHEVLVTPQQRR
ncbi:hypothetical protein B0H63DRAFT_206485 [Podospora didyma]|uniref:Uncharacterized protein n=1 Tax=Podospora didyma TaxID=330526 RepID=A0AAE0TVX6_9PEZI|nr:hypothetical protein B0H63DRAFT_206485 [Podospora didyma]